MNNPNATDTDADIKVTDVDIYPYFHWDPHWGIGPVILPVVTRAHGTYVVDPSGVGVSFMLDITGGTIEDPPIGKLVVGGAYVAKMTGADGKAIVSPTLTCTGEDPVGQTFAGFQATTGTGPAVAPQTADASDLIVLEPLTDMGGTMSDEPGELVMELFKNGTGNVVATRVGTPHLMGVRVEHADWGNPVAVGAHQITVAGRKSDGERVVFTNLTVVATEPDAVFLQHFPA